MAFSGSFWAPWKITISVLDDLLALVVWRFQTKHAKFNEIKPLDLSYYDRSLQ